MKYIKKFMDSLVHKFLFIKHGRDIGCGYKELLFTRRKNCNFKSGVKTKLIILDWLVDCYQYKRSMLDWYTKNYYNLDVPDDKRPFIDFYVGLTSKEDKDNNITWKERSGGDIENYKEKSYWSVYNYWKEVKNANN